MRHLIKALLCSVSICILLSTALADTQWVDMVSPINHSLWPDIAVADFNTDGIPDIVAANPDDSEAFSDYSGLPVWIGKIYNGPGGQYYWGLASGSYTDGVTATLPVASPSNQGNAHVSCVYPGNSCNMMAEWTFEITKNSGIKAIYTTSGNASFSAYVPNGVHWPDRYHSFEDEWTFRQIENTDDFNVSSARYGGSQGTMTLGQVFTSTNGAITIVCERLPGKSGRADEHFVVVTRPPLGEISVEYRGTGGEIKLQDANFETEFKPVEWFVERTNLLQFRFDLSQDDINCYVGDSYTWHTPLGPKTDFPGNNRSYETVEAVDVNQDGQVDIIGAGPDGVDIYYQTGPSISSVGFIDEDEVLGTTPHLDVILGILPVENVFPDGYIDTSAVYDELWSVEWAGNHFEVYGEILGSGGPPYYDYFTEVLTTYCHELTLLGAEEAGYSNGDRYTFSTKRVNFGDRTGPSSLNSYTNLAMGDIDRNGWIDMLLTKETGGFDTFTFDGTNWTYASTIPFTSVVSDIVMKDVNRDGWLDLIASSQTGIHYWQGQPSGGWSADLGPVSGRAFLGVTADDLNKDGYIDIAATEDLAELTGSIEVFYLSADGTWFQNARASVPVPDPNNTGDGFMGIVKVSNSQTIAETWTVVCETTQPNGGLFKVTGSRSGTQGQYASVGEIYTSDNGEVQFTIFDGDIDYAEEDFFSFKTGRGPLELKKYGKLDSSDLDNDGNLDLFAASLDNFGVGVWFGNSNYGWTADTPPESSSSWQSITCDHDLNFDGNPDIVVGSYAESGESGSGIKIWTGKHSDENTWSGWIYQLIANGRFNKLDNGDFNLDGAQDIVLACDDSTAEGIWVFTGNNLGDFEKVPNLVTTKTEYFSVIAGDFNMDGRSDIAAGHKTQGFDVFLTNEDLTWGLSTSGVSEGEVYDLATADMDRDGDLDLVVGQNYIGPSRTGVMIYLNDGNGNFSDASNSKITFSNAVHSHWSVAVADLDLNGYYDIVTTNSNGNPGTMMFYAYDEPGSWSFPVTIAYNDPGGLDHNFGLITDDFNLDSRPDFIEGEDGHACKARIGYTTISIFCDFGLTGLGFGKIRDLASGDLNNDGYPDVVIASEQNGVEAYLTSPGYPGDPSFGFSAITSPAPDGDYVGITMADFTSDGLPDVIAARNQDSGVSGVDMWISYRDFTMARVNGTYPEDNGFFNVGADEDIFVFFSEPMDPATMTYNNIQMTRDGEPIAYSFITENDNSTLRITPAKIVREESYEIRIVGGPDGIRDASGNMFDGNGDNQAQPSPVDDYEFSFTAIDSVSPSIPSGVEVTPGDASATVRWLANADPVKDEDLEGYYVVWELADGSEDIKYKFYAKEELGSPPTVTIRGLTNNVEVLCSVVAKDFTGNESDYSDKVEVTPFPVKPQIWWAGMYDTFITSNSGGDMSLVAYVFDYQGDTQNVELYFDDMPTGFYLTDGGHPDFPAGLGLYALYAPVGPLNTGFVQFPFQLVAHDAAGNSSAMWPYFHVMNDIPGGSQSAAAAPPKIGSWESYFMHKEQQFLSRTEIPFERAQPSTSPDRPVILCAGYTAHPEADFEWGARHWMTAIILDPNNPAGAHDLAYVDLLINGIPSYKLQASGIANEGYIDELELGPVLWGINLSWFGEQNDPDGPDGENHWPAGPQFLQIQAVDRQGNASDVWPNFTIN